MLYTILSSPCALSAINKTVLFSLFTYDFIYVIVSKFNYRYYVISYICVKQWKYTWNIDVCLNLYFTLRTLLRPSALSSQKPMIIIAGGAAETDGAAGQVLSPREGDQDWPEVQGAVPRHHQAARAGAGQYNTVQYSTVQYSVYSSTVV